MANTLPILGTNNLGLTSKIPRWNHQLRFQAGSLVVFDVMMTSDSDVDYRLFMNPIADVGPTLETMNPVVDSDWRYIDFADNADKPPVS